MRGGEHDAFLSYNWHDRDLVRQCAARLERERIRPFLDEWSLTPGASWRPELAAALADSRAAVFFFGPSGAGNVHLEEMRVALRRAASDPRFPIIGVHLPGGLKDKAAISEEVAARTWIEFRENLDEQEPWRRLLEGLRGHAPGPPPEVQPLGERADPRLELELTRTGDGFDMALRTSGGRPLRAGALPVTPGLSGEALAAAVFGPEAEHASLAREVLRGSKPEGLLELGARLDVLSHDDAALALPWRSLRVRGLRLEHGRAAWSVCLHRLGLTRAPVRLRFPCPVWALGRGPALDAVARRMQDRQPGLKDAYFRRLTRRDDVLHFAAREAPSLVYACGSIDGASGALLLEDGPLFPGELRAALKGAEPALLYLDAEGVPPLSAALAWDFGPSASSPGLGPGFARQQGTACDAPSQVALGLPTVRSRAALYRAICGEVTRLCVEAKARAVLIIDEAQHLRSEVLEDLRLLATVRASRTARRAGW